jgi:hypothetical protein
MSHSITLVVPSTANINEKAGKAETKKRLNDTLVAFSQLFGGANAVKSFGAWVSDNVGLVLEDCYNVTSFAMDHIPQATIDKVLEFAAIKANEWKQECVAVFADKLYLVEPKSEGK